MIPPDRPTLLRRHSGQDHPRQLEPAPPQHLDPAPLILTLALAPADQARLNLLRDAYFPPERNFIAAHVTMFHHLPGLDLDTINADLGRAAALQPFPVRVARLQSLGRGVALALESEPLLQLRAALARLWADRLTQQDRQGYRPHVTIQNKVDPAAARLLLVELSASFSPWTVDAAGLALWHYRGGPWEPAGLHPFRPGAAAP